MSKLSQAGYQDITGTFYVLCSSVRRLSLALFLILWITLHEWIVDNDWVTILSGLPLMPGVRCQYISWPTVWVCVWTSYMQEPRPDICPQIIQDEDDWGHIANGWKRGREVVPKPDPWEEDAAKVSSILKVILKNSFRVSYPTPKQHQCRGPTKKCRAGTNIGV